MFSQIKGLIGNDVVFYSLLLVTVGIGSFGLGRISTTVPVSAESVAVSVTESDQPVRTTEQQTASLVASKNGSKYHYLWCPGAQQMKEENKVFFASPTEARAAGYEPAANCEGLE